MNAPLAPRTVDQQIAQMVALLEPHASSLEALWEAMPGAFKAALGRQVDQGDAHDLALCHAALSGFPAADHDGPEDVLL